MSTSVTVTHADIAEVATKLDGGDQLTDKDRDTLAAVFALAGEMLAPDVEGFASARAAIDCCNINFTKPDTSSPWDSLLNIFQGAADRTIVVQRTLR